MNSSAKLSHLLDHLYANKKLAALDIEIIHDFSQQKYLTLLKQENVLPQFIAIQQSMNLTLKSMDSAFLTLKSANMPVAEQQIMKMAMLSQMFYQFSSFRQQFETLVDNNQITIEE